MLVKCPGCYTTYRVGDNLIGTSKPTFRCSRCKLIFALDLKSKVPDEPKDDASIQTTLGKRGEEPSLPFPSSTSATTKDDTGVQHSTMTQTESAPSSSESDKVEIQTSLKEDPFAQRADPFAPEEKPSFQSDPSPIDGDDSIAEIQRFLAESQEPPSQSQETFNQSTDFSTGSAESADTKGETFFNSQDSSQATGGNSTKPEDPISATDFFAQSQQPPTQERESNAESQETFAESQETFYPPAEEPVTSPEESASAATENVDPFGYEREAPSRGDESPATGYHAEIATEPITSKPKVREYRGKTFGVKKKSPDSDAGADSAPQTYVERRRPPIAAQESHAGGPVSIIPYISLFGILLLTFSLLTLIYQAQPARVESYLKSIPWVGSVLFKNSHLRQGVVLESLSSGFQKILGGRQVFVITGKISNRNQVSVRDVRLEGLIQTEAGKELGRQTISVGNPISSKIIRDMTVREIAILQRLKPQKRFEIAPNGSAAFTIVFLRPSKDIKTFTCRVLTTKGAA